MSGSETNYTARLIGPEILEAGRDNTITCPLYRDGQIVTPISGALTLYNAANVKLLDAVATTNVSQVASYTVTAATLTGQTNSTGWRIEWALTLSVGVVRTFPQDAALVYRRLYPVIAEPDLYRLHSDLARRKPKSKTSYQDYIDEAWARIESRLINSGKRPWLIMAPSSLRDVLEFETMAGIFADFATDAASAEWHQMERYEGLRDAAWDRLTYPEADPTTGQDASPGRRRSGTPSLWMCQSPKRWPTVRTWP